MAKIPTTNIGMNLLQNEYGGSNPINMSEYYRKTANNGRVDNSYTTAGGYITPVRTPYVPGISSSYNQKAGYRREAYVNRYPYIYIPGTSTLLFGADSGEPIGQPPSGLGLPSMKMLRIWIWAGVTVYIEAPRNDDASNGPGTNSASGWIGSYGSDQYYYYTPNAYIYTNTGALENPGYAGCQNPPQSSWPQTVVVQQSVGPKTGISYGALDGTPLFGIPLYAYQSQVFYGLREQIQDWTAPGTGYSNQTVPTDGTISLGDFKNQENLP